MKMFLDEETKMMKDDGDKISMIKAELYFARRE